MKKVKGGADTNIIHPESTKGWFGVISGANVVGYNQAGIGNKADAPDRYKSYDAHIDTKA